MHGDIWRIENEEDLFENCEAAKHLVEYAEMEGRKDDVRWFFEVGYANFVEETVTGIFKSYSTPEYKDYLFSIIARKNDAGKWECKIQKKVVLSEDSAT